MGSRRDMESCLIDEKQPGEMSASEDEAKPSLLPNDRRAAYDEFNVVSNTRRSRKRAVTKTGYTNLHKDHVPLTGVSLAFQDMFTYLIECRWRVLFFIFFSSFLVTWLIFGALYWLVAFGHGDLKGHHLRDPKKEMCVTEMEDFISCFLFSMETQYSSGYGTRSPTTECPEAIFMVGLQSIFGALLQAFMTGIVFAKFARPKMRSQAVLFSEKAVICMRDGVLCLMFRVGDIRKSRLLGATLNARLLQHRISPEGERLPHYQHTLDLRVDSASAEVFLLWPLTVVHAIDANSPLYDMSAADLAAADFEILVVLSGTVETMGQDTEARTSYLSSEIVWGDRFRSLVRNTRRGHALDYRRFDQTVAAGETPRCSARQLHYWTHNYALLAKQNTLLGSPYREPRDEYENDGARETVGDAHIFAEKIENDSNRSLLSLIDSRPATESTAFSGEDLTDSYGTTVYRSPSNSAANKIELTAHDA